MTPSPKGTITVKDGQVIHLTKITSWNGEAFPTIIIDRTETGFSVQSGDPSGGGRNSGATLRKAMQGFHPGIITEYEAIFNLRDVSTEVSSSLLLGYETTVL